MNSIHGKMSPNKSQKDRDRVAVLLLLGTQLKLSAGFVVQCLLSRFSLVYDIQSQKEKDSTYL